MSQRDEVSVTQTLIASPPRELLDPDGEGIYLLSGVEFAWSPGVLIQAAFLFFNDWRRWRDVHHESVWMRPKKDNDEWERADIGKHPRGWKLNLPRRWFPAYLYAYCTPKPEAM